jgi:hypothetical protein
MTAKTIFRIFTLAPSISRAAAQNSEQASQPSGEALHSGSEASSEAGSANNHTAVAMHLQVSVAGEAVSTDESPEELALLSPVSSLQRTCRDCGSPLDPFGDCPRIDPRGREMERAPRYCEPNMIHWSRQSRRGEPAVGRRSARL